MLMFLGIEIKVKTFEGQYGTLNVYVIPNLTPKQSQVFITSFTSSI